MKYSFTVKSGNNSWTASGHDSLEEAVREAFKMAYKHGWQPPRWWEFWRIRDTRLTATLCKGEV